MLATIPHDILYAIFRYLPIYDANDLFNASQVSSQWRRAALSEPRLWSVLTVNISAIFPSPITYPHVHRKSMALFHLISEIVARSGGLPLHIHFIHVLGQRDRLDCRDDIGTSLFRSLTRYSGRFASLTFITDLYADTDVFVDRRTNATTQFPQLRTLFIEILPRQTNARGVPLISAQSGRYLSSTVLFYLRRFGATPSLTRLYLPQYPSISPSLVTLPNLSHLIIGSCPKTALLKLLQDSRSSLAVCIVCSIESDDCPMPAGVVSLPSLQLLTIPTDYEDIEERLEARSVRRLDNKSASPLSSRYCTFAASTVGGGGILSNSASELLPDALFWSQFGCVSCATLAQGMPVFTY